MTSFKDVEVASYDIDVSDKNHFIHLAISSGNICG
jgi:hypothetical protein